MVDSRTTYEKDVDRFLYTRAFRRLAEITQVAPAQTEGLPHTRMTHSLKVAQVGQRLVQQLQADQENAEGIDAAGGLEREVVFAAGLAHDIGHPPFGHAGEKVLDDYAVEHGLADGFEGNAQTFRLLTRLTKHVTVGTSVDTRGMNLQARTVAASVKYPWRRQPGEENHRHRKYGVYDDDYADFQHIVEPLLPEPNQPTLEATIMDWADDITYALHDVEDFYLSGLIPLERLQGPTATKEADEFLDFAFDRAKEITEEERAAARTLFLGVAKWLPARPFGGTELERAYVSAFVSQQITELMGLCRVRADGRLAIQRGGELLVAVMKQLTWRYVIDTSEMLRIRQADTARLNAVLDEVHSRALSAIGLAPGGGNGGDAERVRRLLPSLHELLRGSGAYMTDAPEGRRRQLALRSAVDFVAMRTEAEISQLMERLK